MRIKKSFASLIILTIFLGGCSKRPSEFIVPKSASSAPVGEKSILDWQLGSSGWKSWVSTKTIVISIVAATVIVYQFYTNTRVQEKLKESLKKNEAAVPPNEAAVPPNEAAVPPNEAAVPPNEAAVPPNEAAAPPNEAAAPPNEAAANRRVIGLYVDTINALEICLKIFVNEDIRKEVRPMNTNPLPEPDNVNVAVIRQHETLLKLIGRAYFFCTTTRDHEDLKEIRSFCLTSFQNVRAAISNDNRIDAKSRNGLKAFSNAVADQVGLELWE